MRLTKLLVFLCCLLALIAVTSACEDDEEEEPTAAELIARGKKLLGEGDGTGAYLAFQEALEQESGNLQARYGVVLADVLQFTGTIDLVFLLFEGDDAAINAEQTSQLCQRLDECDVLEEANSSYQQCLASGDFGLDAETIECVIGAPDCQTMLARCVGLTFPPDQQLCTQACQRFEECGWLANSYWTQSECVKHCPDLYVSGELECLVRLDSCQAAKQTCFPVYGDSIQKILAEFWAQVSLEMGNNLTFVQTSTTPFAFDIEKYNFTFLDLLFQPSLAGVHDISDTYFFGAIYSMMDALFSAVLAVDLNFNPVLLETVTLDIELDIDLDDFGADDLAEINELLTEVDAILLLLLNDPVYADFFTAPEEEDQEMLRRLGEQIGWIFGNLAEMIERVAREETDQTDDAIRYVDLDGNGRWNAPEPLIVPGVIEADYDLAWAIHNVLLALKVDFVDGYPFQLESLNDLFDYFNLSFISAGINVLDLFGIDEIDLGGAFREPTEEGLRPTLYGLHELIGVIQTVLDAINA